MINNLRIRVYLGVLVVLFLLIGSIVIAQDRITVVWFVGLGTGTSQQQIEAQYQVVEDFNMSQTEIELIIEIAPDSSSASNILVTSMAAGTAPDIVGPIDGLNSNIFGDYWLDLSPFIEAQGYDLGAYNSALVDLHYTNDGQLTGLPFLAYPSVMYYNRNLFDVAGLNYPPQTFGEPYIWVDGSEVPWDYYTLAYLAALLTMDSDGNIANDCPACAPIGPRPIPFPPGPTPIQPQDIIQYGLNFQWAQPRLILTYLQPENLYYGDGAYIPESWHVASEWLQQGIWESYFIPNNASNDMLGSNLFATGYVAMTIAPIWYNCCAGDNYFEWDMGVVPRSLDGAYHVATDTNTFHIPYGSSNPDAAFTVLSYLTTDAVPTLAEAYGGLPVRAEYQDVWIDNQDAQYSWGVNWYVASSSLNYVNSGYLSHTAWLPNLGPANDRINSFGNLLFSNAGAGIDLGDELDNLEAELDYIVNQ